MIDQVVRFTLPAAYSLLPRKMNSPEASALLLAIGLQESGFVSRRQGGKGPARGFWQFEQGGVRGVMSHQATEGVIADVLINLRYGPTTPAAQVLPLLEHNDILAACFARCLLWTLDGPLPLSSEPRQAWAAYVSAWRPGKPRRSTWNTWHEVAWAKVEGRPGPPLLEA